MNMDDVKSALLVKVAESTEKVEEAEEALGVALDLQWARIRRARAAGASLGEIAKVADLSRARIQQITRDLGRRPARAPKGAAPAD